MDSLRSACQTSSPRRDWIPFRFFGSLFMKLFLPALDRSSITLEQPHLIPWPSMPAVCCTARRAQVGCKGNPISWAFRVVTDVFFQIPAQTPDRVEFMKATRSVRHTAQWKASSRKALGGIFLVGTKVSLFVLHHCSKPVCIWASVYWHLDACRPRLKLFS